jgi:hypothetical protein
MLSKIQMRALETCCYVIGAGAFGVFTRWLQNVAGTNEEGLYNNSVWGVFVPLILIAGAFVFIGMVRRLNKDRYYFDEENSTALKNGGKVYPVLRIAIGAVMAAGALLLIMQSEVDTEVNLLRVVGLLGFLTGVSFPLMMKWYGEPLKRPGLMRLFSMLPVLFFSAWLITTYKRNDINGVVWQYGVEVIAVSAAICAFFRMAGFSYDSVKPSRILFSSFFGIFMLIVTLGDERYLGQQVMLVASAAMLLYYDWVLIVNMKQREAPMSYQPRDGFERL